MSHSGAFISIKMCPHLSMERAELPNSPVSKKIVEDNLTEHESDYLIPFQ